MDPLATVWRRVRRLRAAVYLHFGAVWLIQWCAQGSRSSHAAAMSTCVWGASGPPAHSMNKGVNKA
eukprot:scaffold31667_cov107-Isochrysis_galbana.AAC.2